MTFVEYVAVSYERSWHVTLCDNSVLNRLPSDGGRASAEYVVVSHEVIICAEARGLRLCTSLCESLHFFALVESRERGVTRAITHTERDNALCE